MCLLYITLLLVVQLSLQNPVEIDDSRIYKGKVAIPHSAPYQIALFIPKTKNKRCYCGGSLITTRFVLTAAHCLTRFKKLSVMIGGHSLKHLEPNTILMDTTKFKFHEKYNGTANEHDIGVIELPTPVKLTKFISTIKLPKNSNANTSYIGKYGKLTGCGVTSNTPPKPSTVLKELRVRIVDKTECIRFHLRSNHICGFGEFNGSACKGDSGSPLVLENTNTQIGLVSYGDKSCTRGLPHMYTKVEPYLDWIQKNSNYKISK